MSCKDPIKAISRELENLFATHVQNLKISYDIHTSNYKKIGLNQSISSTYVSVIFSYAQKYTDPGFFESDMQIEGFEERSVITVYLCSIYHCWLVSFF